MVLLGPTNTPTPREGVVWSRISGSLILGLSALGLPAWFQTKHHEESNHPSSARPRTSPSDAWGVVPATWTQLGHDDDKETQTSPAERTRETSPSKRQPVEATRFDITAWRASSASRLYGTLPDRRWPLTLGLHQDFGHNGTILATRCTLGAPLQSRHRSRPMGGLRTTRLHL